MSTRTDHWRNTIAQLVVNWVLNHVATKDYARKIFGLINQGMFYARTDPFASWQFTDYAEKDNARSD